MNSNFINNKEISIKCVVVGDSNAGKSSLLNRYIRDVFDLHGGEPTIGSSFFHKPIIEDGIKYRFDMWDTAGQERYRSLMPMYYRNSEIVFICFELSRPDFMEQIRYWISELNQHSNKLNAEIVLVATKCDLIPTAILEHNIYLIKNKFTYSSFYTSSKNNINVSELFNVSFTKIIKNRKKDLILENNNKKANIIEVFEVEEEQSNRCYNNLYCIIS